MMRKKTLLALFLILMSFNPLNSTTNNFSKKKIDKWELLIQSIIHIESKGNPNAVSKKGTCVGAMQIKKVLVDDCNRILKLKKINKSYTYEDRYDLQKSIEMFNIIQNYYNKTNNINIAIRLWNGGCGWKKGKHNTQPYYDKVIKEFNKRFKQKMEANYF